VTRTILHLNGDSNTLGGRTEVSMPHVGCPWTWRMLETYTTAQIVTPPL
jgi:hypothetical protein